MKKKEKKSYPGPEDKKTVCLHFYFCGVVQGVGFRYTAVSLASEYGIKGWVRNTPDGKVEIMAQASPADVERFCQALLDSFPSNITSVERQEYPADRSLRDFQIKFFSYL